MAAGFMGIAHTNIFHALFTLSFATLTANPGGMWWPEALADSGASGRLAMTPTWPSSQAASTPPQGDMWWPEALAKFGSFWSPMDDYGSGEDA
ncbi:hypothetical protein H257_13369 [Aphanomyces astaci]|uniref:Uncharacterized protein n=1 Tax=Aphanomyces astaci TaxID=112090 RepID=W4FXI8_APHAT|nr:hypothetical protein H257_13369 [Aphanomyces astaci]ETV71504.1 hypothetical protein H257_13369 [Aphanomyces astaci]|eukprot:XP_009839169.1 hypothetical protein H257_13369 [Aphanomyces astaci]